MIVDNRMTITDERAVKVIHKYTSYRPQSSDVACASGAACVAPEWLRRDGKRPPSWEINGHIYCADCTQAWVVATARLEHAIA